MEEMNKSNQVITYLSSGWPLRVFMPLMTSHCIMHLWEEYLVLSGDLENRNYLDIR